MTDSIYQMQMHQFSNLDLGGGQESCPPIVLFLVVVLLLGSQQQCCNSHKGYQHNGGI
jgi:hypothetical protein